MVAVVILLRVLARYRSDRNTDKISNVRSFIILRSGERVISFILKITVLTFLVKNGKMKLSGRSIFREYAKKR